MSAVIDEGRWSALVAWAEGRIRGAQGRRELLTCYAEFLDFGIGAPAEFWEPVNSVVCTRLLSDSPKALSNFKDAAWRFVPGWADKDAQ